LFEKGLKHGSGKKILMYWMLIVVEFVNFKVSNFLKRKSDLPEAACEVVHQMQTVGVSIKYVRLDNAGENMVFAKMANNKQWNLRLVFEFTGAGTPQRNYLVEVGFSTLSGRLQAMFDARRLASLDLPGRVDCLRAKWGKANEAWMDLLRFSRQLSTT
jgi:hypothetical protein